MQQLAEDMTAEHSTAAEVVLGLSHAAAAEDTVVVDIVVQAGTVLLLNTAE